MALADICGFNSFMKPKTTTPDALHDEMMEQCANIDNNYQLAMPPFENVSNN